MTMVRCGFLYAGSDDMVRCTDKIGHDGAHSCTIWWR